MLRQFTKPSTLEICGRGLPEITKPVVDCVDEMGFDAGLLTLFGHRDEGPDDVPAHVCEALTAAQLPVPLTDGRLALGTLQEISLSEHRLRSHRREVMLHLLWE